jgi:hypothetical protein
MGHRGGGRGPAGPDKPRAGERRDGAFCPTGVGFGLPRDLSSEAAALQGGTDQDSNAATGRRIEFSQCQVGKKDPEGPTNPDKLAPAQP